MAVLLNLPSKTKNDMVKKLPGLEPKIGKDCFIAETAAVVGDVTIGDNCSIWYGASLRGDDNSIVIGDRSNIQDCAVVHCSEGENGKTIIGNDVVVGHNATVHAATIGDKVLVGMGCTILDGAVIGTGAMIGAHALVLSRTQVGEYELWAGVPAKFIKKLTPEAVERTTGRGAKDYVRWAQVYRDSAEDIDY